MMASTKERKEITNHWSFDWPTMEVLVAGASSIDLPALNVRTRADAESFARNYGFDPDKIESRRVLDAMYVESLTFIQRTLMPKEWAAGLKPPKKFFEKIDPINLLVMASEVGRVGEPRSSEAMWACAILRVMHTIAHLEGFWRVVGLNEARNEMMARFSKNLFRQDDGTLCLGSKNNFVEIDQLEWKHQKSRSSILLKLLHKRANVAENVYDLLGVRIVTKRLCDVLLVVKLIEELNIVTFPNCNPARARNTLVDLEYFKDISQMLTTMIETGKLNKHEFDQLLDRAATPQMYDKLASLSNPHSGQNYRSIQFTSRILVAIPNAALSWLSRLKSEINLIENPAHREALTIFVNTVPYWVGYQESDTVTAFVPYEFQILDRKAFFENKSGDSAHDRYKSAQIRTARKRVLGSLVS